jgi:hypothetical protein
VAAPAPMSTALARDAPRRPQRDMARSDARLPISPPRQRTEVRDCVAGSAAGRGARAGTDGEDGVGHGDAVGQQAAAHARGQAAAVAAEDDLELVERLAG